MYPRPIARYYAPTDVPEVLALLAQHTNKAKLLAGGQSLLPLMKSRQIAPATLIDLNRVRALEEITERAGTVRIGALVRHAMVARHPLLRAHCAVLSDAAGAIGDPQTRNRGTLAGSLAHAEHTGDIAPALIALGARLHIARANGSSRMRPVEGFVYASRACDLLPDELVLAIELQLPAGRAGGAYVKQGRVAQDRAIVAIAAQLTMGQDGRCRDAVVVVSGIAPRPQRVPRSEAALVNRPLASAAARAGELAARQIATQSDAMASNRYRSQLIAVLVPEALRRAAARAAR